MCAAVLAVGSLAACQWRSTCATTCVEARPNEPSGRQRRVETCPKTNTQAANLQPTRIRRAKDGAEMVLVPDGTFQAGAIPQDETALDEELPRKALEMRAFYLDATEVTNGQFSAFVRATAYRTQSEVEGYSRLYDWKRANRIVLGAKWDTVDREMYSDGVWSDLPVVLVSGTDALAYARWAGARLPTEMEFERALRGTHGADSLYPWGDASVPPIRFGNYYSVELGDLHPAVRESFGGRGTPLRSYVDGFAHRAPVRSYLPNESGVFDLSGNVTEIVSYDRSIGPSMREALVDATHGLFMLRGGSFAEFELHGLRNSSRNWLVDGHAREGFVGFRLARDGFSMNGAK